MTTQTPSPLMQQYLPIKEKYPDSLVFFQVGDFYELFFDDAKIASDILSITLTKRGTYNDMDIPLCGIPCHMIETHTAKLVRAGKTVIICDQLEQAQVGKLVNRGVSEVISPATVINENISTNKNSSYILFISFQNNLFNVFFFEFITQNIFSTSFSIDSRGKDCFFSELEKYSPQEIIIDFLAEEKFKDFIKDKRIIYTSWKNNFLYNDFIIKWMNNFNINMELYEICKLFLNFIKHYHENILNLNFNFNFFSSYDYLFLDSATQKHLELCENQSTKNEDGTLFQCINHTATSMGSRLLKKWLLKPSISIDLILKRQKIIKNFISKWYLTQKLYDLLKKIGDLERVCGRIKLKRATYRDYQKILNSNLLIDEIIFLWKEFNFNESFFKEYELLNMPDSLKKILEKYIVDENILGKEIKINNQADEELNLLHKMIESQTAIILDYEQKERERTGIADLYIKSTPLYGYVFELSKLKYKELPSDYTRVQTLSQKERYTTQGLKELEYKLLNAKDEYTKREKFLYSMIQDSVYANIDILFDISIKISNIDALISLTKAAHINNWSCPEINLNNRDLEIIDGKHPVISSFVNNSYVSNDLNLNSENKTWIITGPNMGGKSTFMRQNALIVLLTHIGSFVPAKKAIIPIMDAIFTRIGASDNVFQGKSTFFVEMEECETICRMATENSFIVLDEIGRGTSTYDGMSIAAAIINYLSNNKKSYVLFATHYHELNKLLKNIEKISWHHVETKFIDKDNYIILYKMLPGISNDSMGIFLAKKVGLNDIVINLANSYKYNLEKN